MSLLLALDLQTRNLSLSLSYLALVVVGYLLGFSLCLGNLLLDACCLLLVLSLCVSEIILGILNQTLMLLDDEFVLINLAA